MTDSLASHDATAVAELVRRGAVTPLELVDAAIARIEKVDPQLNAVIIPLFDKARRRAQASTLPNGPFRGVPFLLKDLFCQTAGDPYHAGMRLLRERGWTSGHDTYLAAKFIAAGFVVLGKTNAPELGPVPTTEPVAHGPTRNPWDTSRTPMGSSGGSAAAVAAGLVPVAHGNDGGGSIRVPASACGLVGLKPSRGRTSLGPDFGESWSGLVAEHVLTRSVRDTAAILDVAAGPMPGDPYYAPPPARSFLQNVGAPAGRLRIALMRQAPGGMFPLHADCAAAVSDAARLLETLGHDVQESHPPALDDADFAQHVTAVVTSWTAYDLDFWSAATGTEITASDVEPYTWALADMGRAISAPGYIEAVLWLQGYTRRVASWWEQGFDLLLTPTMCEPPPPLGS